MIPIIIFIRIPPGAGSFLFQAAACSRVRRIPGHGDLYLVYNQRVMMVVIMVVEQMEVITALSTARAI